MRTAAYDKYPCIDAPAKGTVAWEGWPAILDVLKKRLGEGTKGHSVLVVDVYPGVDDQELLGALRDGLEPSRIINTMDLKRSEREILQMIDRHLTNDRIFGVLSCHQLEEFFDSGKMAEARRTIEKQKDGIIVVYGVGADLIVKGDLLVYADLARWEIQLRYRRGMGNWEADNGGEDTFRKYKRSYFVEWRVADRHKFSRFDRVDYFLDTNVAKHPKLAQGRAVRAALGHATTRPFRVVPLFDPAPWGGQWMKEVCGLKRSVHDYGWCFDCVPEENSLFISFNGIRVELPSIDLVYQEPVRLLGDQVHARFGREFPIRFDFLDTMEGGHLSFQVHPVTEYIQQHFGMHYTQDESYYMLDAGPDARVYLGLAENVDPAAMTRDLIAAQKSADQPFNADKYVASWPAAKHDHFLIPAGTVHCSGRNSMVLEISATPYIFTFKMWDWGRLGLDGQPRPVHLDHGIANIQWDRTADWVRDHLVNRVTPLASGDGWSEERTGLHEREFIETRRHWFTATVPHDTQGTVNVLNLVEGEEAIVESPSGSFAPFVVHYAETFIVPAAVGRYTVRPHGPAVGTRCATMKAFVRS
jgi:mannose-6-phosphate isomerase class I